MSGDVEQVFAEAVKATKGLKKLPYVDYAHRLHNKVRNQFQGTSGLQDLQACVDRAPTYPEDDPDPDNWAIDIFGIGDLLTKLMIPSVANGIAGLESDDDPQNLRQYVDQNSSHLWYLQCITNLLGFCLVEHVNRDLKSRGALTIDDLWHNEDFKRSLMQFITNPEFIRTEVRTDVLRDDHLFSIVWLLIADYMSDRDHVCRNTPVAGSEFQNRPSYQALVQWSYTLWAEAGGKGDPDQMDSIVRFCGRVASFALCPLDATTGFQVPAQTFTVTKAFYEMSETGNGARAVADDMYNRELRESLQRLQDQEEIVNEWQSYCMALTHAWESEAVPLWEEGLYRAFKAKKWSSIQSWLHDACNKEGQYGLVGDNRPVREEVCGIFNPLMVSGLLPGTPIALADGSSRPVEDIYSGDVILAPDHPGKSVVVRQNRLGRSPKTRLVGFNGQPPCMPASQVFQTTTGPRAVDVKGARCFNPYRNIGQLAVGHMLFRLEGHEWITVEIKSIDRGKVPRSELTHTLALAAEHQTYHAHGYVIDTNAPCHTLRETGERLRQVPEDQRLVLLSTCKELSFMFQRFDVQAISQRLNWELFGQYSSSKGNHPVPLKSIASLSFRDRVKLRKAIDVPKGVAIERLKRKFALDAHAPDRLPAGYELPTLTLVDGYLMVDDEVQLRSTYDPYHRSFRWTRELQQHNLFEHGVVEIYSEATAGRGAIYLSSEFEPQRTLCRDQAHSFEAQARSLDPRFTRTRRADDDGSEWQALSEWQITYDRSIWPADEEERTEPQDPVDAGIIEDGWWASQGVNIPGVRLPALDDLRDQINQKYGQHLGELYQSVGKLYSSDETYESYDLYNVRWNRASLVPFVSNTGLDVQKTFDVGFPGLDIDVTIPALFQEMTLKLDDSDFLDEKITGYFFEYDPTKRGNKGNRHLVTGTLATSMAVQACRSKISQAYAPITKPGQTDTANERLQPARITETLLSSSALSIKDLVNLAGYNEISVHNDTQTLIKEMMLYHMDSNQREKILQQPKPVLNKDIPVSLADDLPQKLKEFFKNKYAPAFISRYVGRTSKYMNSFTEKEMNNLWYWWQGNGKNSLSQSEEYNDINRLASREAMFRMNEEKLAPYRADNPDNWAEQLCTFLLNNPRQLRKWANFPIDDSGNNLINKQCNILDILSPSKDWAGQFFNQFMALILSDGLEYADIEQDGDQDAKYPWLHDSMHDLIVKVLNDDPSISGDVEAALREQIEEFEKQNNLNQQADAAQRAAAIVEKSASFMKELTGWLTYIGKGVQAAFGGASLWKWVGEAFDRVASKVSLPGAAKLKGISTICMVSMTVATVMVTIWTLTESWNDMSDAQRTDVIIEVIRMVTDGLDKGLEAWKSYQSKPASTPADELNMETLGQNLTEEIMEHGETIGEVAEKIAGDEDYRVVMADGLHSEGVTTAPEGEETWNEDINAIAEDVPPSFEEAAKKFNWSGKLLRVFNAVLGLGLIVAMSFSLANDWNSLSDPGKVLGVLNVVVQGLTVLLDVIEVGSDIGLWAVTETMSVALPILGAVLAVVGIVLMVVQVFINLFTGSKQPPDPVSDFIDDEAHALIGTFDTAPSPQLSYTISDLKVAAGQVKTITIKGENKSSDNVTISNTVITLYSGDDSVCLFRNGADETENIQLVDDSDPNHDSSGYTYVTPADTTAAQLPIPARLGTTSAYYEYDLQVAGPRATSTKLKELVVRSGEYIQSVWTAKINNKGDSDDSSVSWIEIVENGLKDRCQVQFALQRV
ncbi:uncharacterized protein LDX57_011464 [Aspergillus melleus]|uniref:uncharacterized protein n=1 Tax=Aspergillus melleus TaxID=138277 RepID=UPI001E8EBC91|nr:uncharacterized protein LDX57_011464 [Aspergillus melleus]KAH8433829.1 hypothetical protein LDX57_011464 [Aspergillus melleus]